MKLCDKCGAEFASGIAFCPMCGATAPLVESSKGASDPRVAKLDAQELTTDEAREAYVGKNYAYYSARWARIDDTGNALSWNWAACFGNLYWFAYRKMYVFVIVYMAAAVGLTYLFPMPPVTDLDAVLRWAGAYCLVGAVLCIVMGAFGNSWYRRHADKRIAAILADGSTEGARRQLVERGGTSVAALVFLWLAQTVFSMSYSSHYESAMTAALSASAESATTSEPEVVGPAAEAPRAPEVAPEAAPEDGEGPALALSKGDEASPCASAKADASRIEQVVAALPYSRMRVTLIAEGWSPEAIAVSGGASNALVQAAWDAGYQEVGACSEESSPRCTYRFQDNSGNELSLTAVGGNPSMQSLVAMQVLCASNASL